MTTVRELLEQNDFYDEAIVRHGFTDYMRDYDVIVHFNHHRREGTLYKYQFIGSVEATYLTSITSDVAAQSLADDHVFAGADTPDEEFPSGFIWSVRYANAYPGLKYVENGERAHDWSQVLRRKMHEIDIETNVFRLKLVFADIRIAFMGREQDIQLQRDNPLPIEIKTSDGGVG